MDKFIFFASRSFSFEIYTVPTGIGIAQCTLILQHIRIVVEDVGFEPGTGASAVWRAINEPQHLQNVVILTKIKNIFSYISGTQLPFGI